MPRFPLLITLFVFCVTSLSTQGQSCSVMSLGRAANLHGFVAFPADNAWNQDISSAPVDPNSSSIISFIGDSRRFIRILARDSTLGKPSGFRTSW